MSLFNSVALIALLFFSVIEFANANSIESQNDSLKPKVSIVIDDLGDNSIIARKMLSLPGTMTAAILPHSPHAELISNIASERGHDVIMHLPMEAFTRPDLLGPGALFSHMEKPDFVNTFNKSVSSIPRIIGFNNHMGSLLTKDEEKMRWLMLEAKEKSLLFLDSKTTGSSLAEGIANKLGVASIGRDIFLDHKGDSNTIETQFSKLKKIARSTGKVVAICHPYPETLEFLEKNIIELQKDFNMVGLSQLFEKEKTTVTQPSLAK